MKHLIAISLLLLVEFHGPNGHSVFIAPQAVADITYNKCSTPFGGEREPDDYCGRTRIRSYSGDLYVIESPEDVAKRLRDAKD